MQELVLRHLDAVQAARLSSSGTQQQPLQAWEQRLHEFDDAQYLCVIRGAGERAFSAGSDLKAIAQAGRLTARAIVMRLPSRR